jgi:hypothetical protein
MTDYAFLGAFLKILVIESYPIADKDVKKITR